MGFRADLKEDYAVATAKPSKLIQIFRFALVSPGFRAVVILRLQLLIESKGMIRTALFISQFNQFMTGAEFIPGLRIGPGLVIRHPTGIVIGNGVSIGKKCVLQHGVTIGVTRVGLNPSTQYPKIGDEVTIGTHAVIVGAVKVGDRSTIGALTYLDKSVPSDSTAIGIPAMIRKA
jgi:serine O-acetyltransferase